MASVTQVSPANDSSGIALGNTLSITFDAEMDIDSLLAAGNIAVTSAEPKVILAGPNSRDFSVSSKENFLLDSSSILFLEGALTTADNRTFVFTPAAPLSPNTIHKVLISSKVVTRTLGNVSSGGGNAGTGSLALSGPFTGAANTAVVVTIAAAGALGAATYTVVENGGQATAPAVTDRKILQDNGIVLEFKAGNYEAGDTFAFDATVGEELGSIYSFSFTTGESSYIEPSETIEAFQIQEKEIEGLKRVDGIQSSELAPVALAESLPGNESIEVDPRTKTITLTFNKDIDPASLSDAFIEVLMESLPFDTIHTSYRMPITSSVSGKTLTLKIG